MHLSIHFARAFLFCEALTKDALFKIRNPHSKQLHFCVPKILDTTF